MRRLLLVFVLATAAAVVTTACRQQQPGQQQPQPRGGQQPDEERSPAVGLRNEGAEDPKADPGGDGADPDEGPLLLLDEEPLLLLDEDDESPPPTGPMADNSRCHHCHLNYVEEEIAVVHARANIGCADCHGNCDEHIADESWASGGNGTPPEIMYPREKVNPCCLNCHPREKIETTEHEAFLAGTAKEKYCTDCHGDHRLTERKCKWR
ncbi:MAG: hypothetical protein ACYSWU_27285 [Planctomycetota bacterium]|jgi:hypothetical protein